MNNQDQQPYKSISLLGILEKTENLDLCSGRKLTILLLEQSTSKENLAQIQERECINSLCKSQRQHEEQKSIALIVASEVQAHTQNPLDSQKESEMPWLRSPSH